MLSSFYEYHVIEHRFRHRLICFFRGKFERSIKKQQLRSILGRFKAPMTVKGLSPQQLLLLRSLRTLQLIAFGYLHP